MNAPTNPWKATALVATLLIGCTSADAKPEKPALPPRPEKRVEPLPKELAKPSSSSSNPGAISLTGRTRAHRESALATTTSGPVRQVLFEPGDYVKPGQVLVRIDERAAQIGVRQAQAALNAARTQAAGAKRDRERLERVGPQGAVPKADVERAVTGHEMAEAQVAQAEAALAMAEKNLGDTAIRAPFAGLVLARRVDEGEWLNTMSNAVVASIADVDPLEVALAAPEHLVSKIAVGDTMKVRFGATDQMVEAKVSRVVRAVDPTTRSFEVVAEIPNPDRKYAPGLFAEAVLDEVVK